MQIPFAANVEGVVIVGVVDTDEPSVRGTCAGAVNGNFAISPGGAAADVYDPTRNLMKISIVWEAGQNTVIARIATRNPNGQWDEHGWVNIASW